MFFATIMFLTTVTGFILEYFSYTAQKDQSVFAKAFAAEGLPFNYNTNIFIPQMLFALLIFGCYLWCRFLIVPLLKKALSSKPGSAAGINWLLILLQGGLISFVMALGANAVTFYAHPHYYNYEGFKLTAIFGYNENPFASYFTGIERAGAIVVIFTLYMVISELIIRAIDKKDVGKSYSRLITNQLTLAACAYIFIPFFLQNLAIVQFESRFLENYFILFPPVIFVYLSSTYWLFPATQPGFFKKPLLLVIYLGITFLVNLFFVSFLGHKSFNFSVIYWLAMLCFTLPAAWLIFQQWKDKILELKGVEQALVKSNNDLQFLRSQINPHFLFNTLNTLYSTSLQEDSFKTAEGIQKLGDMMRYMLHDNNKDVIPLSREVDYLENYISLQKLRIQSSPDITVHEIIGCGNSTHQLAPMLLIPLVENAFKHGISLSQPSWIKILLECDEKSISFEVRNSVHPLKTGDPEFEQSGVGLANIKNRLALLYAGRYSFSCESAANEFVVKLHVIVK